MRNRKRLMEPYVIQVVEPSPPVNVPEDAIILPYDPDSRQRREEGRQAAGALRQVRRALEPGPPGQEDRGAGPRPPVTRWPGPRTRRCWTATSHLLLTGQMEIDVFVDGFLEIPLGLGGGVLSLARTGRQARAAERAVAAPMSRSRTRNRLRSFASTIGVTDRCLLLHVSGKGRHRLELAVRLKLSRQGGWRVAEGVLPAAPAAALEIVVPQPQTELRLAQERRPPQLGDREAGRDDPHRLGPGGAVRLRWRPAVAAGAGRSQPDGRLATPCSTCRRTACGSPGSSAWSSAAASASSSALTCPPDICWKRSRAATSAAGKSARPTAGRSSR